MIKIYKMNDCDWVAAESKKQAIEFYESDNVISDTEISDVRALTRKEADKLDFMESYDTRECSFSEKLKKMIDADEDFPCLFATTEF